MRINVYAEEMTDRVELVTKGDFTGIRFYLYMPVTIPVDERFPPQRVTVRGPFMHHTGDDDSSAVTFWGKRQLKEALQKAIELLEQQEKDAKAPF